MKIEPALLFLLNAVFRGAGDAAIAIVEALIAAVGILVFRRSGWKHRTVKFSISIARFCQL